MMAVPCYLLEEHHEAFLLWNHARVEGWIPRTGGVLLHVDQHSDLVAPRLHSSPRALGTDAEALYNFTFDQLSCADFIVPALYQGMFDEVCWMQRDLRPSTTPISVGSYQGNGTLLTRRKASSTEQDAGIPDGRVVKFSIRTLERDLGDGAVSVLDIDLDYFSCANAFDQSHRLEITRHEYDSYQRDRHHCLRMLQGSAITARAEDGHYYFYLKAFQDRAPTPHQVSDEEVVRRVDAFGTFLERNRVQPNLIDIARSRITGYTPVQQWSFIEDTLLQKLRALYALDLRNISELFPPAHSPVADAPQAEV